MKHIMDEIEDIISRYEISEDESINFLILKELRKINNNNDHLNDEIGTMLKEEINMLKEEIQNTNNSLDDIYTLIDEKFE